MAITTRRNVADCMELRDERIGPMATYRSFWVELELEIDDDTVGVHDQIAIGTQDANLATSDFGPGHEIGLLLGNLISTALRDLDTRGYRLKTMSGPNERLAGPDGWYPAVTIESEQSYSSRKFID